MCQACLEAELWLAYQEELAEKQKAADAGTQPRPAKETPPDRPAAPFACEEPPAT